MSDTRGKLSTWGGSVVRGHDGKFHMFSAQMTHNTGIVVWMSNSRIRHAVSTTGPYGPYEPRDIAFGLWGHEPTVARAPTGEYVLFWTAHFGEEVPCSGVPRSSMYGPAVAVAPGSWSATQPQPV